MKTLSLVLIMFLTLAVSLPAQERTDAIKFYNTATQKTLVGTVEEIGQEETADHAPFIILTLREKESALAYRVEVSPRWFFEMDLMAGSLVEVKGSDVSRDDRRILIAAAITYRGEKFLFRDTHGFPLWRGRGKDRQKQSGQGTRYRRGKG
jgi:hypothetical protein